uniref:serine/threonine-protein kinase Sgk2-like isoform X2 n=1 Tax=Myxine glutinosa TaxID=7769 RepID=UPI00358F9A61
MEKEHFKNFVPLIKMRAVATILALKRHWRHSTHDDRKMNTSTRDSDHPPGDHERVLSQHGGAWRQDDEVDQGKFENAEDADWSFSTNTTAADFDLLKILGRGSFGKVLLGRHKSSGKFYAIKVLQKSSILQNEEVGHIMAERNVLAKSLRHPFLVALHCSFQTADKLYLVLDYANGGELFFHLQRVGSFPEARVRFYAAEITSAIGFLHSINIIYRDLKPENILLDSEGHIKLTDFGLCKEGLRPKGTTSTFCGTAEYLAPEILQKQPYDRTVDWWCLGSVTYEMLFGIPPFFEQDTATMYECILHQPLCCPCTASPCARVFLAGLLCKEPRTRLGAAADFDEISKQKFFAQINWEDLNSKRIQPPFNPNVAGPCDLRHIDPEFTEEPISSSLLHSGDSATVTASMAEAEVAFVGFSYIPVLEDIF